MPVIPAPSAPTHDLGNTRFTSLATPLAGSTETAVWMVEIDPGAPAIPHAVTRQEVFVVLSGTASVTLSGVTEHVEPGGSIVVPAGLSFEITNASDDQLKMLCCLPVGGKAVTSDGTFTPPWAL